MRRRVFITGSFLAAAAAWRAAGRDAPAEGERMPDGRTLVRGAALAFGTTVSIAAVHDDRAAARAAIADALADVRCVDGLMTVFRPESQVGRLNAEGALSRPDAHLVRVLEASRRMAELSGGAFDPTVQPLWLLFVACRRAGRLPAPSEIATARSLVDWTALEVSPRRVALRRPGMAVTLNGIAQGYAADLAVARLAERGVRDAIVDAGEHGAEGARQPDQPWRVGVQHPRDTGALLGAVEMDGRFVAASGDYATAFSDDLLYHHIFDPHTGVSPRRLSEVVVAARTGLEADALTKPMMILEQARAEALLARFEGAGALWIDKQGRVVGARGIRLV